MPATVAAPRGRSSQNRVRTVLTQVALVAVVVAFVWLGLTVRLPDLETLQVRIEGFGWWGWLVFIGVYAVVGLTPIPITIMAVAGGFLFGVGTGTVLSVIGSMIGSWGAYLLARALGRRTVMKLLGSHRDAVESRLDSAGFTSVFALRVTPGIPYWPVNYAAGALAVPQRDFVVASVLASIPGQLSLVAIGAFVADPSVLIGVVALCAWAVVLGMTIWALRVWRGTAESSLPGDD